jgi:prephenate dehydrogenase
VKTKDKIGILYPGQMGVSVAFSIKTSGYDVYWISEGRSRHTIERAQKVGLEDVVTLANLCKRCTTIISVCPPHLAEDVAQQVLGQKYSGNYLDANAWGHHRPSGLGTGFNLVVSLG